MMMLRMDRRWWCGSLFLSMRGEAARYRNTAPSSRPSISSSPVSNDATTNPYRLNHLIKITPRRTSILVRFTPRAHPLTHHSLTPSTSDPPHRTSTSFSSSLARHRISRLPSLWFYASFLVPFHLPSITRSSSPPPLPPSFVAIMSLYDEQLGVFDDVTRALAVAASRPSTNASECPSTRCTYYIPQVIARKAHFRSVIDSRASLPSVLLPLIGTHMYVRARFAIMARRSPRPSRGISRRHGACVRVPDR